MANRRSVDLPTIVPKVFASRAEVERGIAKLQKRLEEVRRLRADGVRYDDGHRETAQTNLRETVREVFGPQSPELRDFEHHHIDRGGNFLGGSDHEYQQCFLAGVDYTSQLIEGLISRLQEKGEDLQKDPVPPVADREPQTGGNKVFVVHGHDEPAREVVARYLEKLGLDPVVLRELPNGGRTIIEKFEAYSDVSYAVVILTPDDLGSTVSAPGQARLRARQNVVFELGFFVGRLGRSRVCALHKGDVEMLSDYQGVLYVPLDSGDGWRLSLARELKHAGLDVDLNRAL